MARRRLVSLEIWARHYGAPLDERREQRMRYAAPLPAEGTLPFTVNAVPLFAVAGTFGPREAPRRTVLDCAPRLPARSVTDTEPA